MKTTINIAVAWIALGILSGCGIIPQKADTPKPNDVPAVQQSGENTGTAEKPKVETPANNASKKTAKEKGVNLLTKAAVVICGSEGTGMLAGGGIGYLVAELLGASKGAGAIIGAALGANCGKIAEDRLRAELAAQGRTDCRVSSRSVYRNGERFVIAEVESCEGLIVRAGYRKYGDASNQPLPADKGVTGAEQELFEERQEEAQYARERRYQPRNWREHRDEMYRSRYGR